MLETIACIVVWFCIQSIFIWTIYFIVKVIKGNFEGIESYIVESYKIYNTKGIKIK